MSFVIDKTYLQGDVLTEGDLDEFKNDTETLMNVTKLDGNSINIVAIADSIADELSAAGANAIASSLDTTGGLAIVQKVTTTEGYMLQANALGDAGASAPFSQAFPTGGILDYDTTGSVNVYSDLKNGPSGTPPSTTVSVSLTVSGRPLRFTFIGLRTNVDAFHNSYWGPTIAGGSVQPSGSIQLVRDGVALEKQGIGATGSANFFRDARDPLGSISFFDLNPGTGTRTYKFQACKHTSCSVTMFSAELVITEY